VFCRGKLIIITLLPVTHLALRDGAVLLYGLTQTAEYLHTWIGVFSLVCITR